MASKFTPIPATADDQAQAQRTLRGRLTPRRFQIIKDWCRRNTWRNKGHCCSHDCCGHVYKQDVDWTFNGGDVVLTQTVYVNI